MTDIKYIEDRNGNRVLPITSFSAVRNTRGDNIGDVVGSLGNNVSGLQTGLNNEISRAQTAEIGITNNVNSRLNAQDQKLALLSGSEVIVVSDHTQVSSPDSQKIYREIGTTSYTDWMYQGGTWYKLAEYNPGIDDEPTAGSNNLVKSGGVFTFPSQLSISFCNFGGYINCNNTQKRFEVRGGTFKILINKVAHTIPNNTNISYSFNAKNVSAYIALKFDTDNNTLITETLERGNSSYPIIALCMADGNIADNDMVVTKCISSNIKIKVDNYYQMDDLQSNVDNINIVINEDERNYSVTNTTTWNFLTPSIPKGYRLQYISGLSSSNWVAFLGTSGKVYGYYLSSDFEGFVSEEEIVAIFIKYNATVEFKAFKDKITDSIPHIIPCISLPQKYMATSGKPFELFWKNMIVVPDYNNVQVDVDCTVGSNFKRKYLYQNPITGTYPLNIKIYDLYKNLISAVGTKLVVTPEINSSPATNKNILCVGDSLLVNGVWAAESFRRFVGGTGWTDSNGLIYPNGLGLSNITFIGNMKKSILNPQSVGYEAGFEANGGWGFSEYNENVYTYSSMTITVQSGTKGQNDIHSLYRDSRGNVWKLETIFSSASYKMMLVTAGSGSSIMPSSGTLTYISGGVDTSNIVYTNSERSTGNPFWNPSTNEIDYKYYMTQLGKGDENIDIMFVLLGINDVFGDKTSEQIYNEALTFIQNVQNATTGYPNCKIVLMKSIFSSYDGDAENYGCSVNWIESNEKISNLNNIFKQLELTQNNIYAMDSGSCVDLENAMQVWTRQLNSRTSETEEYQVNGLHPDMLGYLQIADSVFNELNYLLQV